MKPVSYGFLTVFAGLFPIINPPATSMLFLAITRHGTTAQRRSSAMRDTWPLICATGSRPAPFGMVAEFVRRDAVHAR